MNLREEASTPHAPEVLTQLNPDDLSRLSEILLDAFGTTAERIDEFVPKAIDAGHADIIVSRNTTGLIASVMVVNMLHGTRALFGKIDDVATHPDSRRQGHAGVVLDYALEWFRNRGAEMVMLDSEDDRQPAHRLYESRGFKRYETNQFHLDLS